MKKLSLSLIIICTALLSIMNNSSELSASTKIPARDQSEDPRQIEIDLKAIKGPHDKMFRKCVGAGRANEGLRADWQEQLSQVQRDIDFRYIRFHGLYVDDMGVFMMDRNGQPQYNFQYVDKLFDYLLSVGIKPFVELSFTPNAMASGDRTIFWYRGNVTPPRDFNLWGDLVYESARHWTERYGADEVKTWYFEVWNEPNLEGFWTGTMEQYFELDRVSVEAVRRVDPSYKVGGPATAGSGWIEEMLDYCQENDVPIDFIATHDYGVQAGFLDEFGNNGTILDSDREAIIRNVRRVREIISQSSFPNLELHYTEWSSSYTPADPYHDTYQQAPYVLNKIKGTEGIADGMSYWVFTDIFEEPGPRFTPFHGGFGMINYQGIPKPVYFAYEYMARLGATELQNDDVQSWACMNEDGSCQLLFWDFRIDEAGAETNNQVFYAKEQPARPIPEVSVTIKNLDKGEYELRVYRIGYRLNDAYTTYLDMGSPSQLSRSQEAAIKSGSTGKPVLVEKLDLEGSFERDFECRENDVYLIELQKISRESE